MSTSSDKAKRLIQLYKGLEPFEHILQNLNPSEQVIQDIANQIPGPVSWSEDARRRRLQFLEEKTGIQVRYLNGAASAAKPEELQGNIECFIGMSQVPTGLVGPVLIQGTEARGEFYVPMATTEGALIASYNRGAAACRLSGGITSVCLTEGVQRAPLFKFKRLNQVGAFMYWVLDKTDQFRQIVSEKSRYAKLEDFKINMEGNQVMLIFEYTTGDAAGQNMVTLCTDAICQYIIAHSPVKPDYWFVESNYSGDKKATAVSFTNVRGKKVTAECVIRKEIVAKVLNSAPADIVQYWQSSAVAAVQSGTIGIQGHVANGLAAIFLACGQDVACVAEAYVGITRFELTEEEDLYLSVTLPSLMVGTVGGGTHLPTQQECLAILGCAGTGKARKFAEVCAATVLSGELSIAAALASGHFSKAHRIFGRKK